jgi:quercetin dioxygenase-like cupin family protein
VIVQPRRIVTGHDSRGRSVVVADEVVPGIGTGGRPGSAFHLIWGTDGTDGTATQSAEPRFVPFFPGAGGTRFLLSRWAPASAVPVLQDAGAIAAEDERNFPGLTAVFESDHPGMHRTDTVDYGMCIEGELWLELDDGREVLVTPGTCVVQRGTRHAWHNRSDRPALMLFVMVGAGRAGAGT